MLSQRQALDFLLRLPLLGRLGPVFLRYLLVGGLGFLADALLLEIFVRCGLSVYIARILSMTLAMGCTYALHRNFTFTDAVQTKKTTAQVVAFVSCQLIAAAVNYGVFCLLLKILPEWNAFIARMFALCWGVGAGLAVNFALLRLFVFPKSGAGAYEGWKLMRLLPWLAAAVYLFQMAWERAKLVALWPKFPSELGPNDPDVWMRLSQVRAMMDARDFFDHTVAATNAPYGGIASHWTRPMDFLLAVSTNFSDAPYIEIMLMQAAAWVPPVLGLIALAFLMRAAVKPFNHTHAAWCAAALCAVSPLKFYFFPGDADHHGLLAMLWCGVLCCLMKSLKNSTAIAAGALLGLMVWVSIEALMPLAAVYAVLGWFTLKRADEIKPLALLAASAAVVAALGMAVEYRNFTEVYDTLSIVHVALLGFIAAGAGVLCLPQLRRQPPAIRAMAAASAAAVVLFLQTTLFDKFLFGPMVDTDPFIGENFLKSISEAVGLFDRDPVIVIAHIWQPLLAAALLYKRKKRAHVILAALLAATFLMTLVQGRWTYYVQPAAIIAIASLLPAASMRLRRIEKPLRSYAVLFGCALLASILSYTSQRAPSDAAVCQRQMRYIVQTGQLQEKLGMAVDVIHAPASIGGDMLFFTPYGIIAGFYHREGAGLRELDNMARDAEPEFTRRRYDMRQVGAVFSCPALTEKEGWLHTLSAGKHPAWLEPLPGLRYLNIKGPKPELFAVKKETP